MTKRLQWLFDRCHNGAMQQKSKSPPKLVIRNAVPADIEGIRAVMAKAYASLGAHGVYSEAQLLGQMHQFPQGQFVATYDGRIIGYCATFLISESLALKPHDWATITGRGYASRHDPAGDWVYGMDVCIDPEFRGRRIGQRLYNERKKLCQHLRLKGVVFAGRMPNLARRWNAVGSAENYLKLVIEGKQRDPVIGFQIRNGFEPIGVLPDYLPLDHEFARLCHAYDLAQSAGAGRGQRRRRRGSCGRPQTVRVAAVQYQLRAVTSFEEFAQQVEYFVDVVADYKADFAVFPELFTLQLLSIENRHIPAAEAIAALTSYTARFKEMMSRLAVSYNVNIIGGSHPTREADGEVYNVSYVFLRDGSVHEQRKVHPTPNERYWWNIKGGDRANVIDTDCGPIGVLDLLRLRISGTGPACDRPGRGDPVRSVLHRRAAELYARALLRAGARGGKPMLRRDGGQCRQPAEGREHGYPVFAKLRAHALRFSLRARRHRLRHDAECRDGGDRRSAARQPARGAPGRHRAEPQGPPLRSLFGDLARNS